MSIGLVPKLIWLIIIGDLFNDELIVLLGDLSI